MPDPNSSAFLPHMGYDLLVFGFSGEKLKILLMEYHKTGWSALPGRFVGNNESLDNAVQRRLRKRTGLNEVYLEQFYTLGSIERFKPEVMMKIMEPHGYEKKDHWLFKRFISIGYYALINYKEVEPKPDKL